MANIICENINCKPESGVFYSETQVKLNVLKIIKKLFIHILLILGKL